MSLFELFGSSMLNGTFCSTFDGYKVVLQAAQKNIEVLLLVVVFIEPFYTFLLLHNKCSDLYHLVCIKCDVYVDKLVNSLK